MLHVTCVYSRNYHVLCMHNADVSSGCRKLAKACRQGIIKLIAPVNAFSAVHIRTSLNPVTPQTETLMKSQPTNKTPPNQHSKLNAVQNMSKQHSRNNCIHLKNIYRVGLHGLTNRQHLKRSTISRLKQVALMHKIALMDCKKRLIQNRAVLCCPCCTDDNHQHLLSYRLIKEKCFANIYGILSYSIRQCVVGSVS